jgi:hypothetical protein
MLVHNKFDLFKSIFVFLTDILFVKNKNRL